MRIWYPGNGMGSSPFLNNVGHCKLDKPVIMGEFYFADTDGVLKDDVYTYLLGAGYAGGWRWQYANADPGATNTMWPASQKGLQNLCAADKSSVDLVCP